MNFNDFKLALMEEVKTLSGEDTFISFRKVKKNNGIEREGISIVRDGDNISPLFYLNGYYDKYKNGASIDSMAKDIILDNERCKVKTFTGMPDADRIREHLMFRIVNYHMNRKMLENMPHFRFLDLAGIYYVRMDEDFVPGATILVTYDHLDLWDLEASNIREIAMTNTMVAEPTYITDLAIFLPEIKKQDDISMHIMSNSSGSFGASCLAYESICKELHRKFKEDMYIIPSSVHEVLLVPKREIPDREEVNEMIRTINDKELQPEDIQSDHVYEYLDDEEIITA